MGKKYRALRHPRTTQELRRNEADEELVRPKRRSKRLPNAWDDIVRSDIKRKHSSWKRSRKQQYAESD